MRRMFWLSVGAVLGVTGYRRVTALARSLRPQPLRPGRGGGVGASTGRGGGVGASTSLTGFAADVREGMAIYMDRQAARPPDAQDTQPRRGISRGTSRNDELKDGR